MLFNARAENFHLKLGYKLMIVQRNRSELTSNGFMYELASEDIKSNLTGLYTPQQDGVVKTSNRIIVNNANAMIKCVNCPKSFGFPVIETAVYIRNYTTSRAIAMTFTDCEVISYELWCCQKPNIRHLHVQGCSTYIMVPKERR